MRIYASLVLVAVCLAVYALELANPALVEQCLLDKSLMYSQPYRVLTHAFVHSPLNVSHLLYNAFALALFGVILERTAGTKHFLLVFFTGVVISGIAGTIFYDRMLGSSGGIFAVLGAVAVLHPRAVVVAMGIPMPMIAAVAVWMLMDFLGLFAADSVAHASHLAGLAAGLIYGAGFRVVAGNGVRGGGKTVVVGSGVRGGGQSVVAGSGVRGGGQSVVAGIRGWGGGQSVVAGNGVRGGREKPSKESEKVVSEKEIEEWEEEWMLKRRGG